MTLQIGITGGIGSGKSLVRKIFESLNVPSYEADSRAKILMNENQDLVSSLKKEFGNESYDNGALDRKYLASIVFSNPERLKKLNEIVHPVVGLDYQNWLGSQKTKYIVKEDALMFETGTNKLLDKTITVYAPMEIRIQRILLRDPHRSIEDAKKIISNQMSDEDKKNMADHVIYNDGRPVVLQVLKLHRQFMVS